MLVLRALLAALLASALFAGPWSRFRGPNGSGISADSGFPTKLGPATNVRWKTPVRRGKSSPVLARDRVFLTSAGNGRLYTQCFDRSTGRLVWERAVERGRGALLHELNEPASTSPVTDGENVYAFFEDAGLLSYDADGQLRWRTELGPFSNEQGLGASPIIVDGLLVLQLDHAAGSYIAAFDPDNGETVWKTQRAETDSWTTPLAYRPDGGRTQILTVSTRLLGSYDAASGKRTLREGGFAGVMVASPVLAGDTVFAFGYNFEAPSKFSATLSERDSDGSGSLEPSEYAGHAFLSAVAEHRGDRDGILEQVDWDDIMGRRTGPSRLAAMRLERDGSEFSVREVWRYERSLIGVIPSPLVYERTLYFVKNGGILHALDAETGAILKRGRLSGAVDGYSASPVAADGRVYFFGESGKVAVVKAGADWEVLGTSDLEDGVFATPALADGAIYVRTDGWLYRFED